MSQHTFSPADFDALVTALSLEPDLVVVAIAISRARAQGVQYPIQRPDQLVALLGSDRRFTGYGHDVTPESIHRFLLADHLPIDNEQQLAASCRYALARCRRVARLERELTYLQAALQQGAIK